MSRAQGYECRQHPHTGRGGVDGPGAVPGEAPHRHQELRARALPGAAPGLKLQEYKLKFSEVSSLKQQLGGAGWRELKYLASRTRFEMSFKNKVVDKLPGFLWPEFSADKHDD